MKKTPLKRKTPLKAKVPKKTKKPIKVKKRKKSSEKTLLKKKLWKVFSLWVRQRDDYTCFTCGRKGEGAGMHAGHMVPKASGGMALYFHPLNVHGQCYHCNINLGGNGAVYAQKFIRKYGQEEFDNLMELKNRIEKWSEQDYKDQIEFYTKQL